MGIPDFVINVEGNLEIRRKNTYCQQFCPFSRRGTEYNEKCGSWCPLFGEPKQEMTLNAELHAVSVDTLELCNGKILEGKLVDKRR